MAQTLRYVDQLLANFPDNSSGLIDAVHVRDFTVSFANGAGFVETTTDVNIPITSGVPVLINPLLVGVASTESLWSVDGNNFLFPNYTAVLTDTVIPAGYTKVSRFQLSMALTKSGAGGDNYEFQMTRNGAPFGVVRDMRFSGADTFTVDTMEVTLQAIDVSDLFGVQVTGIGTGDDLTLESFTLAVSDSILVTAP